MRNAGGQGSGSAYPQDRAVGAHDAMADERRNEVAGRSPWHILGALCIWLQLRRVAGRFLHRADEMSGRSLLWIGWATVAVVVFQTAPLSRIAYNPQAVEIYEDHVTMYRSFPLDALGLPRPQISYSETIRPITEAHNGGQSCTDQGGPFQYTRAGDVGMWSIAWAADCTSDPAGFHWSAEWTWHIGRIKLGPAKFSQTFLKG